MYANNEIGSIANLLKIEEMEVLKCINMRAIAFLHVIAFRKYPRINLKEVNIDLLSLSAHKFHGPKGVGVLAY